MKKAIEFLGEIEKGIIHLPENYISYTAKNVRVILLIESTDKIEEEKEKDDNKTHSQREEVLSIFEQMQNRDKPMFSKIDNPTEWQKNIRDEWE